MSNFKLQLQSFGKALLFPISLLSFMAIFLGLSAALQNPNIIAGIPFMQNEVIQNVLTLIRKLAGLPFAQLPLLFAMAIPMGMVKRDREVAVYSAVVGYIALLIGMSFMLGLQGLDSTTTTVSYLMETEKLSLTDATLKNSLFTNSLGIFTYNINVIGGILAGLFGVFLHNKFRKTELPPSLSFYSGKRFVPIISALVLVVVGIVVVFIWPAINSVIIYLGSWISNLNYVGVFLYGFLEKFINPTGLHHILNQTFRFTALGGMENVGDTVQVGALNIYFAQLEQGLAFSTNATAYLAQGKILHMVFGMPAVVFALYKAALPETRKKVFKYYIAGLSAVILTGITEPIEFTYIFISPLLWIVNSVLAGLSFVAPAIFHAAIGNIQGGIIDWFVFGVLQGVNTKWFIYLILGPIYFALYYFVYSFLIKKFNIGTIGRKLSDFEDESDTDAADKMTLEEADLIQAQYIVDGLGGIENIVDVDNCISRLRVEVKDGKIVNEDMIKKTKPNGIVRPNENNVQIVFGGRVTKMRNIVDDYLYSKK